MSIYDVDVEIEETGFPETGRTESDFSAVLSIEALAQAYFRLAVELKTTHDWFERRRVIRQQKILEKDIFSTPAATERGLQKKARVLLYIYGSAHGFHHSRKTLDNYSVSLAEDALALCGGARRGTGPYKPECIVNYYSWMAPEDTGAGPQHPH